MASKKKNESPASDISALAHDVARAARWGTPAELDAAIVALEAATGKKVAAPGPELKTQERKGQ